MFVDGWHMNGLHMGGMWLYWVALVVLIVIVSVIVAKTLKFKRSGSGSAESALKDRYARGEISRKEFDQMTADIRR